MAKPIIVAQSSAVKIPKNFIVVVSDPSGKIIASFLNTPSRNFVANSITVAGNADEIRFVLLRLDGDDRLAVFFIFGVIASPRRGAVQQTCGVATSYVGVPSFFFTARSVNAGRFARTINPDALTEISVHIYVMKNKSRGVFDAENC